MSSAWDALASSPRRPRLGSARMVAILAMFALLAVAVATPAAAGTGTTVVGELVQAWPEGEHEHAAAEPLSWIETADGDSVRVPTEDVVGLQLGATVALTVGGEVEDDASEGGADPAREVLRSDVLTPPPARPEPDRTPSGGLTNEVTVVLVQPGGAAADATTADEVAALVDSEVAQFWAEQSDGAITLGVTDAHDWVSIPADCSDAALLWNQSAAAVGFQPGPGRHLVVHLPEGTPGCGYALAEVGASPKSGGRLYVSDLVGSVLAHELGHNFGLGHSAGLQCDSSLEEGSCRTDGYRDYYDVMGASWAHFGSLNVVQAARLGFLPTAAQQSLGLTGTTTTVGLAPVSERSGTRAVRLVDAAGVRYWLEYRPARGADAWLASPSANVYRLESGVLLRRADAWPNSSVLLDASPREATGWATDFQAALPVGVAVPVSGGAFTVTVHSTTPAGAVISVAAAALPVADAGVPTAPTGPRPGTVLPVDPAASPAHAPADDPAAPLPHAPAQEPTTFWTPDVSRLTVATVRPDLEAASHAISVTVLLVPLALATVLGATLLLLRLRRPITADPTA